MGRRSGLRPRGGGDDDSSNEASSKGMYHNPNYYKRIIFIRS